MSLHELTVAELEEERDLLDEYLSITPADYIEVRSQIESEIAQINWELNTRREHDRQMLAAWNASVAELNQAVR
jgi:hypothetical protein